MKARIKLTSWLNGRETEEVLVDGVGFYQKGKLLYFDKDKVKQELHYLQNELEVIRYGEATSHLIFRKMGPSSCRIDSEFGSMQIPITLKKLEIHNFDIQLEYQIQTSENEERGFHWQIQVLG